MKGILEAVQKMVEMIQKAGGVQRTIEEVMSATKDVYGIFYPQLLLPALWESGVHSRLTVFRRE